MVSENLTHLSLVQSLADGIKSADQLRIGAEHEKFLYNLETFRPLPYEGAVSVRSVLEAYAQEDPSFQPIYEGTAIIGLQLGDGGAVTLEPGGQLELAAAPYPTLHASCQSISSHIRRLKSVCHPMGIGIFAAGFLPLWNREDMFWMPKGRYRIMRASMGRTGTHGLDMMARSCTVQVNLDFTSEADMRRKMRVAVALQPLATALFASSPFAGGRDTGYVSFRSYCWQHTDPHRTGLPLFVREPAFGFEQWVDYLLDVPMYFVARDGKYHDVTGGSFRDFMAGRLRGFEGTYPTLKDWEDQQTVAFPEIRLKKFIEMRGADSGTWARHCALPALWTGLLYDAGVLADIDTLTQAWDDEALMAVYRQVHHQGLSTRLAGRSLLDWAREILPLARTGLQRRACCNSQGRDETLYLEPLEETLAEGRTPAEAMRVYAEDLPGLYRLLSY